MKSLISLPAALFLMLVLSFDAPAPANSNTFNRENVPGTLFVPDKEIYNAGKTIFGAKAKTEFELVIEIELTMFQGKVRRPYVAVWVENEKGEPVRTLALWFNDYRWLPDLKRWYTRHYEKTHQKSDIDAISGATRPAGKYTVRWDGKDGQGNVQNQGRYTVYIEVVREHGTYQLIRQEFEMNGALQRYELAAGTEISSAIIEYRKTESTGSSQ